MMSLGEGLEMLIENISRFWKILPKAMYNIGF